MKVSVFGCIQYLASFGPVLIGRLYAVSPTFMVYQGGRRGGRGQYARCIVDTNVKKEKSKRLRFFKIWQNVCARLGLKMKIN